MGVGIPRPVDAPGLAVNVGTRHGAPVAGVVGIIAVVAHDEVAVLRHGEGPHVVESADDVGIKLLDVVFLYRLAVSVELLVAHFHHVAGKAHHALYEVGIRVLGILEHDDVPDLRIAPAEKILVGEGNLHPVHELVDQHIVADLYGLKHGTGGNGIGLKNESTDDDRQNHRGEQRFAILADHGTAFLA